MEFAQFVQWVFYGILGGSVVYGVGILGNMKNSIDVLNERVAMILEKTTWHEKALNDHSERLRDLERNAGKGFE